VSRTGDPWKNASAIQEGGMASTIVEFGGPFCVVYFSDDLPGTHEVRLAAAVVWRIGPGARRWSWRSLVDRLRFRFGPLGLGLHLRSDTPGWTGSAGPNGERATLFHPARRVVRVLGREYALPGEGSTLVLLIDESGGRSGRADVRLRTMRAPTIPHPPPEPSLEGAASGEPLPDPPAGVQEHDVWAAALREDPEVRAFFADGS
jgi:hypothetical protein